jgi:predicted nucleic acid-binding protein
MPDRFLFLDTNILLDFYRSRTEAGLSLLQHIDSIRHQIITTYQVEMEFKKHRQSAILESFNALKPPSHIPRPGLFSDAATVRALKGDIEKAERRVKKLRTRLRSAFLKPTTHDPVYKVVQRLCLKNDDLSLTRQMKIRFAIRRLAFKRFILGYPPRKQGDTSIGDAMNWEWIIHCAQKSACEIIIVSRDSDFGVQLENESFLNDWLAQEFRSRTSKKRRVLLYSRLSEALKLFQLPVTPEEEKEEAEIAKPPDRLLSGEEAREFFRELRRQLESAPEPSPISGTLPKTT